MATFYIAIYESYLSTLQRLAGGFIPLLGSHLVHSSQHNEVNIIVITTNNKNPFFKSVRYRSSDGYQM
jgi:hypothetical protein